MTGSRDAGGPLGKTGACVSGDGPDAGGVNRVVEPEILDELAADDPEAVASRADLRRINFLMGNERWILRRVRSLGHLAGEGIVEWGAGSGDLLVKLARMGSVIGVDLAPPPVGMSKEICWRQEDVFESRASGGLLVANLFLHHFEGEDLKRLGARMREFEAVVVVEPWRSRLALGLGAVMRPFVSRVTRHDMPASIRAGFRRGEMVAALGLEEQDWMISESVDLRGGLCWLARNARSDKVSR